MTRLVLSMLLLAPACLSAQALDLAVERRFAEAARLRVGDTVWVAATADAPERVARVAAIIEPLADPATIMRRDYRVRMHLPDLAALLGQPDRVDRFGVALQPGIAIDSAADRLNRIAFGYEAFPTGMIASQSSTTFLVVSRFHRAIAFISILASAIFLLCLMVLKVEARRQDVAVLRFIGISRRTIFRSLMIESSLIAMAGALVGTALAAVASTAVNAFYQRSFSTSLLFSLLQWHTVRNAIALSILLGLAAGGLASWRLVRTAPLTLWRRAG
ncbi:MAG: FtsX-like permease family protein [Gemmatimonadota bacterium]